MLIPLVGCGDPELCVGDCAQTEQSESGSESALEVLQACSVASNADVSTCGDGLPQAGEICLAPPQTIALEPAPRSAVVGDFDADGLDDLLWSDEAGAVALRRGSVTAPLSVEQPWVSLPVGEPGLVLTGVGDLDGDGALDAVGNQDQGLVVLLRGDGAGGLLESKVLFEGSLPWGPAVIDDDGDGDLDLAITSPDLSPSHALLRSDGLGGFSLETRFDDGSAEVSLPVALGELYGDPPADRATSLGDAVLVRAESEGAALTSSLPLAADYLRAVNVELGDVDGDGRDDLVLGVLDVEHVAPPQWDSLAIYYSLAVYRTGDPDPDGAPTFEDGVYLPLDCGGSSLRAVDLDGDGALDVVSSHYPGPDQAASLVIRRGDGQGGFGTVLRLESPASVDTGGDVLIGEFDGDGVHDVVTLHRALSTLVLYRANP